MGNGSSTVRVDELLAQEVSDAERTAQRKAREAELLAFYDRYDPSKKAAVGTLLADYAFGDIVKSLGKKYKDYPKGWYRRYTLLLFYAKHLAPAPDLDVVQRMMAAVDNAELEAALQEKFGKLPEGWAGPGGGSPGSRGNDDYSSTRDGSPRGQGKGGGDGRSEGSHEHSASIEKSTQSDTQRALLAKQLAAFYTAREPSMVPRVDVLLDDYRFLDVVVSLYKKYGELPEGWAGYLPADVAPDKQDAAAAGAAGFASSASSSSAAAAGAPAARAPPAPASGNTASFQEDAASKPTAFERRCKELTAFYTIHDPSKIDRVPHILKGYRFEDVVVSLLNKYSEVPEGWQRRASTAADRTPTPLPPSSRGSDADVKDRVAAANTQGSSASGGNWTGREAADAGLSAAEAADIELQFAAAVAAFERFDAKYERSNENRFFTYALHKQATQGNCTDDEPSWLNSTAEEESKYNAWKQLSPGGVGMGRYTAMLQFVEEMHEQTEGGVQGRLDKVAAGGAQASRFVAGLDGATADSFRDSVAAIAVYDEKWERTVEEKVTLHALFCQATIGDCNQVSWRASLASHAGGAAAAPAAAPGSHRAPIHPHFEPTHFDPHPPPSPPSLFLLLHLFVTGQAGLL